MPIILHVMHSSGAVRCCRVSSVGDVVGVVEAVGDDIVFVMFDGWGMLNSWTGLPRLACRSRTERRSRSSSASLLVGRIGSLGEECETRHVLLL